MTPRLISVNVGLPRDVEWQGKSVRTAIWKMPVSERRIVRQLNIDGDAQGDLAGHGGEIRAVMVYQLESYRYWEAQLHRSDLTFGHFGENFTVEGLADSEVCIGDRYRIGDALFEVTQPRVTCYRVGIRLNEPRMPALLVSHHRPGFYFRVLEEGLVGSGDEIRKVAEGPERMTVAEIDSLLYLPGHPRDQLERSLRIPALSPGWQDSFRALLEQSAGLSASTNPELAWAGFRSLAVSRIERETDSVVSVYMESPDKSPLPSFLPGQFLVTRARPNQDQPAILRNYSLSGAPGEGIYRISVKQEPGGVGSTFVHTRLKAGDAIGVSAPRGSFTLQSGDGPVVLLSAGIGVTPVLAMLHWLNSRQSRRTVWWLYAARNRHEHPLAEEARRLLEALPDGRGYIAYSKPGPDDKLGRDFEIAGHWDTPALESLRIPKESDFYLCGPSGFLSTLTSGLMDWGVERKRIHSEVFGPAASFAPGVIGESRRPFAPPSLIQGGEEPQVAFARSGVTVSWDPRFSSLLELAEACNVPVRWSCRTGVCHTCECVLVGGDVDYSPAPIDLPAAGNVLICCARPRTDLQLDL